MAFRQLRKIVVVLYFVAWFFAQNASAEWANVIRVIDGDTIVLENNQHVRMLGVDTPEIQSERHPQEDYYAKQAKQFVQQVIEGRRVFLEGDDSQAPLDKYGRRLAYIYLEDQTLLNRELVRQGYGEAIYYFPYKFKQEFLTLERQAKKNKLGMWGKPEK